MYCIHHKSHIAGHQLHGTKLNKSKHSFFRFNHRTYIPDTTMLWISITMKRQNHTFTLDLLFSLPFCKMLCMVDHFSGCNCATKDVRLRIIGYCQSSHLFEWMLDSPFMAVPYLGRYLENIAASPSSFILHTDPLCYAMKRRTC